ncbi:MAG: type II toxin-antitoxin system PemK/MazF family toxin [Rectinemataceae bacterium]
MPTFETWDIIKVPFPYTDRPVHERRPALVVATAAIQEQHGLLWVLMITSSDNRGWPDDVAISDLETAGLPAASVVRTAKIATIEAKEAERIGVLPSDGRIAVRRHILAVLSESAN